jgi:hypothetical protein
VIEARDVLGDLARNNITDAELESLYDRIMDSDQAGDVRQLLMLSNQEWTAFGQGAPFRTLAQWRFEGWPTRCANCEKPITVENYGWLVRERPDGFALEHIDCPQ